VAVALAPETPAPEAVAAAAVASVHGPTGTVPVPVVWVPAPADPAAERRRVRLLTSMSVLAVLLVAVCAVFGVAWNSARSSGPMANQAFVDSGATAELVGQVTNAVITVYSYDYTALPANEAAAKAVITGKFGRQFDKVFAPLKRLAPSQMAVVRTTVPAAAVRMLRGDRARLLMMVNQAGTRGPDRQPTGATARLVVDAQYVDGRWKIAEVTPE
jgi:Mce-associated membrane protein